MQPPKSHVGDYHMSLSRERRPPALPTQALAKELGALYARQHLDGLNLYIYGVVLKELQPLILTKPGNTPPASHRGDHPR
jgi:hypothetical protein